MEIYIGRSSDGDYELGRTDKTWHPEYGFRTADLLGIAHGEFIEYLSQAKILEPGECRLFQLSKKS